ncbi:MAG: response regulator transcription factor [Polyangiaceae bacterium]
MTPSAPPDTRAPTAPPVHLLLVEDDARFRTLVGRALRNEPGIVVVDEVGTPESAEAVLATGARIDVALVDLKLGERSGVDLIRSLASRYPELACVALTVFDDAETVRSVILAGGRGYVLKDTPPENLAVLARDAATGGAPMTSSVARIVLDTFRDELGASEGRSPSGPDKLTAREREIVALLCEGRTYVEVATALDLSVGTVQTHVKSVYKKLHVASKAELTALAFRKGLVR